MAGFLVTAVARAPEMPTVVYQESLPLCFIENADEPLADRRLHRYLTGIDSLITMVVAITAKEASCPLCHHASNRLRSRYHRARRAGGQWGALVD